MAKVYPSLISGYVMDDCEHLASLCCGLREAKSAFRQYECYQNFKSMCLGQNEAHQNKMLEFGTGKGLLQIHPRMWVALTQRTKRY